MVLVEQHLLYLFKEFMNRLNVIFVMTVGILFAQSAQVVKPKSENREAFFRAASRFSQATTAWEQSLSSDQRALMKEIGTRAQDLRAIKELISKECADNKQVLDEEALAKDIITCKVPPSPSPTK